MLENAPACLGSLNPVPLRRVSLAPILFAVAQVHFLTERALQMSSHSSAPFAQDFVHDGKQRGSSQSLSTTACIRVSSRFLGAKIKADLRRLILRPDLAPTLSELLSSSSMCLQWASFSLENQACSASRLAKAEGSTGGLLLHAKESHNILAWS